MNQPRILIAGVGNIFFGDDAFGVEVARHLAGRPLPEGVRVTDFGIRGLDLAYALLEGYDVAILVDAVQRGGTPGTLYLIEPNVGPTDLPGASVEPHALDPWRVLGLAKSLGGALGRVLLVGCEPSPCDPEEGCMELSEPVRGAVTEAVQLIDKVLAKIRGGQALTTNEAEAKQT